MYSEEISDTYAFFFNKFRQNVFQQILVHKQFSSSYVTPPLHRENFVFLHGPSVNKPIPFTRCSLPTKHQIRESGQEQLARAIIDTRIQREAESVPELLNVLSRHGIRLAPEISSGCRNGDIEFEANSSN